MGTVYALNTIGTMIGSLAPVFVLVPLFGIQASVLLVSVLYWALGALVAFRFGPRSSVLRRTPGVIAALALLVLLSIIAPPDLCRRVILAATGPLHKHKEIVFYSEGLTSTEMITEDPLIWHVTWQPRD